eukprot:GSChrysophyteH1.ASY1.ANO1.2866.1 assembled CDS
MKRELPSSDSTDGVQCSVSTQQSDRIGKPLKHRRRESRFKEEKDLVTWEDTVTLDVHGGPMTTGECKTEEALAPNAEKEKANFGLSGALAKDHATGNIYNGVELKWNEPLDAAAPLAPSGQFQKRGNAKKVIKPYVIDLSSSNKTFLNGEEIDDCRYYELREKDTLRFGSSTREYVLLKESP